MGLSCWDGRRTATALVGVAFLPAAAWAQTVAPTRDELTRPQPAPEQTAPRLSVEGEVERAPCALADPQFADIRVTISDVQFNNLKGATAEEMRSSWAPYAGRELPVSTICEVRDRAATLLRDKGYLAAVQVPVQRIENGVVRLEVLYGRVTTIRARGQTTGAETKLVQYLQPLTRDEIFDRRRAERYLLLARDLPGYNVQLTLRPAGTAPGELVGEVTVIRRPYSLDATIQNLNARDTGRWAGQVRAQVFGLTGLGDVTTVSYSNTLGDWREQRIFQASHSFRPGDEGLVVDGQLTLAWTRPDIGADDGDPALRAKTLFATIGASYPLVRSQDRNWYLSGGLDIINQRVKLVIPLTRDRLRVLWLRTAFDALDSSSDFPRWIIGGSLEVRRGIDIFDASGGCGEDDCLDPDVVPPSRFDGDPTATLVRAQLNGEYALSRDIAVFVSPRAQYAFDPLLSFEEFTGGNFTVGRGYEPGTLLGDGGVGLIGELRGPRLPVFKNGALRLQPFIFGDAAWAWNKNDGLSGPDKLFSLGGGVRGELSDRLRLDATLAKPLKRAGIFAQKPGLRFLVSLTARLLPWR
jgi:hemolysin activation/secretion protein